jgi:cholest-4-en-3-one 26-monooxygenase
MSDFYHTSDDMSYTASDDAQDAPVSTELADPIDAVDLDQVDLFDPRWHQDGPPHELLARMRAQAPVRWNPLPDGSGCWTVTSHAEIAQVSRDFRSYSSHEGGVFLHPNQVLPLEITRNLLLYMDPPQHTDYRLILQTAFTPRAVQAFAQPVRERVTRTIDRFIERGRADLVSELAVLVPLGVITSLLGVPDEDFDQFASWTASIEESTRAAEPEQATEVFGLMAAYLSEQIARQSAAGRQDTILAKLRDGQVDGRALTDIEILVFFALLAFAGHDTTRNTTSSGILALLEHPQVLAELQGDAALVPDAVEEILRWTSVVQWFNRTALHDTELGGKRIAKGDRVVMWYTSASRDEAVFADPQTFDIHRAKPDHDAFGGGGRHFCLGAGLARLELTIIFEEVTRRLRHLRLDGGVQRIPSSWTNALKTLPVTFTPGPREGAAG